MVFYRRQQSAPYKATGRILLPIRTNSQSINQIQVIACKHVVIITCFNADIFECLHVDMFVCNIFLRQVLCNKFLCFTVDIYAKL